MATKHKDDFRRDAIRIALTSGLTRSRVASDLGVGLSTLNKWLQSLGDDAVEPTPEEDLAQENERLRREIRILREEREVLKNAIRYFGGPEL